MSDNGYSSSHPPVLPDESNDNVPSTRSPNMQIQQDRDDDDDLIPDVEDEELLGSDALADEEDEDSIPDVEDEELSGSEGIADEGRDERVPGGIGEGIRIAFVAQARFVDLLLDLIDLGHENYEATVITAARHLNRAGASIIRLTHMVLALRRQNEEQKQEIEEQRQEIDRLVEQHEFEQVLLQRRINALQLELNSQVPRRRHGSSAPRSRHRPQSSPQRNYRSGSRGRSSPQVPPRPIIDDPPPPPHLRDHEDHIIDGVPDDDLRGPDLSPHPHVRDQDPIIDELQDDDLRGPDLPPHPHLRDQDPIINEQPLPDDLLDPYLSPRRMALLDPYLYLRDQARRMIHGDLPGANFVPPAPPFIGWVFDMETHDEFNDSVREILRQGLIQAGIIAEE